MGGTTRTLIVDDDRPLRMLLRFILAHEPDFTVVGEAADGREAVAAAERLQPDLVLLDLMMPHMDGFEALPLIRTAAPRCVVVVISMMPREDAEADVLRLGGAAFLDKAWTSTEFLAVLRRVLEKARTSGR